MQFLMGKESVILWVLLGDEVDLGVIELIWG